MKTMYFKASCDSMLHFFAAEIMSNSMANKGEYQYVICEKKSEAKAVVWMIKSISGCWYISNIENGFKMWGMDGSLGGKWQCEIYYPRENENE